MGALIILFVTLLLLFSVGVAALIASVVILAAVLPLALAALTVIDVCKWFISKVRGAL